MNVISEIRKKLQENDVERQKLRDQMEEIEDRELRPKFEKQFVGKYFVYENGYNNEDRWPLYQYVRELKDVYSGHCDLIVFRFETIRGDTQIKTHNFCSQSTIGEEISKSEFMKAYKKALKNLLPT